nr:MAG TPA: hypothetical protein [Caudoviricetes sp.]
MYVNRNYDNAKIEAISETTKCKKVLNVREIENRY